MADPSYLVRVSTTAVVITLSAKDFSCCGSHSRTNSTMTVPLIDGLAVGFGPCLRIDKGDGIVTTHCTAVFKFHLENSIPLLIQTNSGRDMRNKGL